MKKYLVILAAAVALAGFSPQAAMAQTARQKDKNTMRNLGIGLGAGAIHEAIKGRNTNALVLGAGAAYSAKKYEDARKAQSKENKLARRYVYKNGKRIGYYKIKNGRRAGYVRYRS